jgi:hypothetical protein
MSLAFSLITVQVVEVKGLDGWGVHEGSFWQKRNLIFRNPDEGRTAGLSLSRWAKAADALGESYLIRQAEHGQFRGLVIQPYDSCYCFEVCPAERSFGERGNMMEKVEPLPGKDSHSKDP